MTFVPVFSPIELVLQLVVPEALPLPPRSLVQLTETTLTLSLALPLSANVDAEEVYVAAIVGLPMAIDGAMVSDVDGPEGDVGAAETDQAKT